MRVRWGVSPFSGFGGFVRFWDSGVVLVFAGKRAAGEVDGRKSRVGGGRGRIGAEKRGRRNRLCTKSAAQKAGWGKPVAKNIAIRGVAKPSGRSSLSRSNQIGPIPLQSIKSIKIHRILGIRR